MKSTASKTKVLGLILAIALLFPGCATVQQSQRVQSAAKVAAYVGTKEYVDLHPESRLGFEAARDALLTLETSPTVDLATLLAVVNRLPVKELKSDTAKLIITSATILLTDYAGSLPADKICELRPLVSAIRQGIDLGLQ